jgi:hypothetical protein
MTICRWILLRMRRVVGKIKTFYVQCIVSPENRSVYEIISKNMVEPEYEDSMAPACGILDKQTYTHACTRPRLYAHTHLHTRIYWGHAHARTQQYAILIATVASWTYIGCLIFSYFFILAPVFGLLLMTMVKAACLIEDVPDTRWFKYDRDKLWLVYTQSVPVIFEPPCI